MTYEQLEMMLETKGYALGGLTADEVEAIAEVEGFKLRKNGKYYYKAA